MGYLLRRTRKPVWIGDGRDREAAVREFARSEQDTDGLSVFEVETDEQRATVVAAIACERQHTGRVDLIEVTREQAESYGPVQRTPDKGTTALPAANELHCSLDWGAATLRKLAEDLFDRHHALHEYAPPAVRGFVQVLDPDSVMDEDARAFVVAEKARAAQAKGKK